MSPVSFGGRFGWLHHPATLTEGAVGVVLVSPLGRDARCAHRPMRLFADRLAQAGYPTLRFDHLGHGDSLEGSQAGDAPAEWISGVHAATTILKAMTGVERIVFGGVRMGASLAALAALDDDTVAGLIALAPVVSGKGWLRELRLAAAMSGTESEAARSLGGLEGDGLTLSPEAVKALMALDIKSVALPSRAVLLFAQNETTAALGPCLERTGAAVTSHDFAGYDPMFEDAHSNAAPEEVFAQAIQWLRATLPIDPAATAIPTPSLPVCRLTAAGLVETPVNFGAGLRGLITWPQNAESRTRGAVIFLNTGGDPRAGIGRFAAIAGRELARRGVASLRFDFPGVGDSADPADSARHIYEVSRAADIQAAMALMTAEGFDDLTVAGVCAGGHHALQAVTANPAVQRVLAVSPVKLVWRHGDSLAIGKRDQGRATTFYVNGLADPTTWKRLVTGDIHVFSVLRTLVGRLRARLATRRDDTVALYNQRFAEASARDVQVRILVGVDDASLDEVETFFGPKGARLNRLPGMSVVVAPGVDHGLARPESRAAALAQLFDLVGAA